MAQAETEKQVARECVGETEGNMGVCEHEGVRGMTR